MADPVVQAELIHVDEEQAWWDENPERLEFLRLCLSGAAITYAQKTLTAARREKDKQAPQISRVTLYEWRDNLHFKKRLSEDQGDYERALLQRRARETSQLGDRFGKMALRMAEKMDQTSSAGKDIKYDDLGKLERLTNMYARMRGEERVDLGVDGKTVTHRVGIVGNLNVNNGAAGHIGNMPFAKLMAEQAGAIDVSMMDTDDPEEALGDIGAQMIAHSGFLDEEDADEEEPR